MTDLPLERLMYERNRMRSVCDMLSAALDQWRDGGPLRVPFYLALAQYIEIAMHRLYIQAVRAEEILFTRLHGTDMAAVSGYSAFHESLLANQRYIASLRRVRERLEQEGSAALESFEAVARDYIAFILANLGTYAGVQQLMQESFSIDDWAYIGSIADEEIRREQSLHDRVMALAPADPPLPGPPRD